MSKLLSSKITNIISTGCMVAAGLVFSSCGADGGSKSEGDGGSCKANEVKASVNKKPAQCYTKCSNGACTGGAMCKDGICLPGAGANNGAANNGAANNGAANNGAANNGAANNGAANNGAADPLVKLCEDVFKKVFDTCAKDQCANLTAEDQTAFDMAIANQNTTQCAADLAANADQKADFEAIVAGSCADLKPQYCSGFGLFEECSCESSDAAKVGTACTTATEMADCGGGDFAPGCFPESFVNDAGMTQQTPFVGGYCTAGCVDPGNMRFPETGAYAGEFAEGACGQGNLCLVTVVQAGRFAQCRKGCSQHSDCRTGYRCEVGQLFFDPADKNNVLTSRYCQPPARMCQSNQDCGGLACTNGVCDVANVQCGDTPIDPNNAMSSTGTEACANANGTCTDINGQSVCILP